MKWSKKQVITLLVLLPVFAIIAIFIKVGYAAAGISLCQTCRENHQKIGAIPDVGFSDLKQHPEKYAGQMIRLHAIFDHDAGYTFLSNPTTWDRINSIPVGFGKEFETCASTKKALTIHTGLGTWYDGAVYATMIGKYGVIDDQRKFQNGETGYTIFCLESVEPIDPIRSVPINAIRFGITQIGRFVF
jgi:hypothetical protein